MGEASIIGIDLAKRTFQTHGAGADGGVTFRRKVAREKLPAFLDAQPRCVVAMEACATAHDRGRSPLGDRGPLAVLKAVLSLRRSRLSL